MFPSSCTGRHSDLSFYLSSQCQPCLVECYRTTSPSPQVLSFSWIINFSPHIFRQTYDRHQSKRGPQGQSLQDFSMHHRKTKTSYKKHVLLVTNTELALEEDKSLKTKMHQKQSKKKKVKNPPTEIWNLLSVSAQRTVPSYCDPCRTGLGAQISGRKCYLPPGEKLHRGNGN